MAAKRDNTLLFVLLGVVAVVGVGAYVVMNKGMGTKALTGPTDAQAAALIAQAQSAAAIAQAKAETDIAETQDKEWYEPAVEGIGAGIGGFLTGIGGTIF